MTTITRSGGFEGSYETIALVGTGGHVIFNYQMYSIPDRLSISTEQGVIFDSGFTSGASSGNLRIPVGSGSITIRLATNDEGTAWDYSISTDEPDCPALVGNYAEVLANYINFRNYYQEQANFDFELAARNVTDLEDAIGDADTLLALLSVQATADTISGVLSIAYPTISSPVAEAIDLGRSIYEWVDNITKTPQSPKDIIDNLKDTADLAWDISDQTFFEDGFIPDWFNQLKDAYDLVQDSQDATREIGEVIDGRFQVVQALAEARIKAQAAADFQADIDAKYARLVQQYEAAATLYKELTGDCPDLATTPTSPLPSPPSSTAGSVASLNLAATAEDCGCAADAASGPAARNADGAAVAAVLAAPVEFDDIERDARIVLGTDGADVLSATDRRALVAGGAGDDTVTTGDARDVVIGGAGDDVIDAGAGFDIAVFVGDSGEYQVEQTASGAWRVRDTVQGRDGEDLITGAEAFVFANGTLHLDPSGEPSVSGRPAVAQESDGEIRFEVVLGRLFEQDVSVPWRVLAEGAADTDPPLASGVAVIRAGETVATITVAVVDDAVDGPDRVVNLMLEEPDHGVLLSPGTPVVGTIHDDEGVVDLVISRVEGTNDAATNTASYQLVVSNQGDDVARSVRLREIFDVATDLVSVEPSGGSAEWDSVRKELNIAIGDLAPGASATVDIDLRSISAGTFFGIAQVAHAGYEANLADNFIYSGTTFAPQPLAAADLSLAVSADRTTTLAGDSVTFVVTLRNDGPGVASNIAVDAALPTGYILVSASTIQGSFDAATGVWEAGNLRDGLERTLTIVATAGAGDGTLTAELVRADEPDPDSTPGNGVASEDDQASVTVAAQGTAFELPVRMPPPDIPAGMLKVVGTGGADKLLGSFKAEGFNAKGGADTIVAKGGNDVIFAGAGNDRVQAGGGADKVVAGAGLDIVHGGGGNDRIYLDAGNDRAFGGAGRDLIWGDDGHDVLAGGTGNDILFGGYGNDVLRGNAGCDVLVGGPGSDLLYGGGGRDAFFFNGTGAGTDRVRDFREGDTLLFSDVQADEMTVRKMRGTTVFTWENDRVIVDAVNLTIGEDYLFV